ncbi:winged helix family two component transcriptional regulator [Trinickia symbiotica]|uniref:DNA-binding response regulator n=1 Tax=Trinickia symbiotica TaxID=863227 RepID=A0A2N7X6H1_9BURK|nr:response regulator transcription factor [Trinickia symbiotica]PMS37353.1 DNA-binding response regulator [Trinickia symbiotica]PPK42841.1 winged helix family two component transcriptional regulator [Trinickia symbiotica]
MRIAILDDDPSQLEFVSESLSPAGHTCHAFTEGRALIRELRRESYDLIVLDWNVADMPGDEVLAWVREHCHEELPVLFMTSRSREADIVTALNAGADDYVVKPVAASILLARVSTLLRRTYRREESIASQEFGEYVFDLRESIVYRRAVPVTLSQKEFQVALLLFRNLGRPLSRSHIVETIWKQTADIPSRTLDTHVSSVRIKLDLRPQNGYCIYPVYGYGYRLEKLEAGQA